MAGVAKRLTREIFLEGPTGEDAGGHNERLSNFGVADGVGIGGGAMSNKVQAGDLRPVGESVVSSGALEPRSEKTGFLRALTGSHNHAHHTSVVSVSAIAIVSHGTQKRKTLVAELLNANGGFLRRGFFGDFAQDDREVNGHRIARLRWVVIERLGNLFQAVAHGVRVNEKLFGSELQ